MPFLHMVLVVVACAGIAAAQDQKPAGLQDSLQASIGYLSDTQEKLGFTPMDSLSRTNFELNLEKLDSWAFRRPLKGDFTSTDWILLGDLYSWMDVFDQRDAYKHSVNAWKQATVDPEMEWTAVLRLYRAYRKVGLAPGIMDTGARLMELNKDAAIEEKVEFDMAVAALTLGDTDAAWKSVRAFLKHFPKDEDGRNLKKRIRLEKR